MYKKPLALFALGAVISTSSFSSGVLQKILSSSQNQDTKIAIAETEPTMREGANFSGEWTGTCQDGLTVTLSIKNKDNSLELNNKYFDINSMMSEGSAHANWYENNQFRVTWNDNKDVLSIHGVAVENHTSDPSFNADIFEISFSLKGNKLILEEELHTYKDSKLVESTPRTCALKRKG